ncbi:MAG: hypothetical protein RLN85_21560, partial [Pseudomonadales bacterium]
GPRVSRCASRIEIGRAVYPSDETQQTSKRWFQAIKGSRLGQTKLEPMASKLGDRDRPSFGLLIT